MAPRVTVGTSGWNYGHWKGRFYPDGLPGTRWLEYYARTFSTLEVNATFYREMGETTYEKWRSSTPDGFLWAVKAHRYITHVKRLRGVEEPVRRFFKSVSVLKEKLGPVLFQLPPSLAFERAALEEFRGCLPPGFRCAIEARHESWMRDEAIASLRELDIGFCVSDSGGRFPSRDAVTSDFAYVRLHGPGRIYASEYSEDDLKSWAARIAALGVDAYVYFDNDYRAYAPNNALGLKRLTENSADARP